MKKILIVEDIELNIDLLVQLLEDDYELVIAKDGHQGVSLTQETNPDLVLMDISLPGMDGYQATQLIRQSFPQMPIIGISAHAMQADVQKALDAGCCDYITKPVDEELLLQKIETHLK